MKRIMAADRALDRAFPEPSDPAGAARLIEAFGALSNKAQRLARSRRGAAALAAIGGHAPYLAMLSLREPDILLRLLGPDGIGAGADEVMARELAALRRLDPGATRNLIAASLRRAKRRAGLAIALADLTGSWRVETVTRALSDLADAAVSAALRHLLHALHQRGVIALPYPDDPERGCCFVVLAMGKLGARELNYSSDIDLVLLFDPSAPVYRDDAQSAMARLARDLVPLLAEPDANGRVFRVDLRLRPDPAATPPVISVAAALTYYESHGRTWERAAYIKARPIAGDRDFGAAFLEQIRPFIWRRHLDFAAIADIHAMKRRIDQRHEDRAGVVFGRDVKLGRGGIREIEFIAQTLELVWGGREPDLRIPGTLAALRALAAAGHLPADIARMLRAAYRRLRQIEHRLQMIDDRQTHRLPASANGMADFARFMGMDERSFTHGLNLLMERVHSAFAEFFDAGDDAPRTDPLNPGDTGTVPPAFAAALARHGFVDARHVAERLRAWQDGSLPALRAERARSLLDRILPRLVGALGDQPDPDLAFRRFDHMLSRQRAGVQLLSLFQHNPALLDRLAMVLGAAPSLADHLADHPGALDALLGAHERTRDFAPLLRRQLGDARGLEDHLTILRRFVRREEFQLSVATLEGRLDIDQSGVLRAELARSVLVALLSAVLADHQARFGKVPHGRFGIVVLGRAGAQEMMPGSDLDLMLIYDHPPDAVGRGLDAGRYFTRLAQSLVTALTASGADGPIYPVDMRLRPSGNKGPVAVSLAAFRSYHAEQSWTWERLALTRARPLAATRGFAPVLDDAIRTALSRDVPGAIIRADTTAMRARLARDAPGRDGFDLKHRSGGMMELGFIVEALQLVHGPQRPDLFSARTLIAVRHLAQARILPRKVADQLIAADHLFRSVQAMLRLTGLTSPSDASPRAARERLLAVLGVPDTKALVQTLDRHAQAVRQIFTSYIGDLTKGDPE
ncbi:MAG TPA: bifunctional [glutamine synthetase] adenylyltransferase/[glutamine synthetase]-adenylyl-L-tyrosine phosphorylase [Acidiphilium sp.]|nr:bifunctional [glutamine synthetase] adenylyltransferase/[glutamine synthetase]-adenylyl-L-tyrosine phosphorylase [Acidiphilium sp.]HQU24402.1 bifunctional [glutamine synthetase] adenylyltransferase/[glutamine synthetase]-adenylyl-L-tyrosine phosphorylase [Acidiphilium sp.]